VRGITDMISVSYVRQEGGSGAGARGIARRELVGEEPFAVVLADDVIEAETRVYASFWTCTISSMPRCWPS